MVALEDRLTDWSKSFQLPESVASMPLENALLCLYAADQVHGNQFLERAVTFADRLIAEDRCHANPTVKQGYPRNEGVILRSRNYARWLLGQRLDQSALRIVAGHLTTWCLTKAIDHARFHDSITMSIYLDGVRAAMVSGDVEYVRELLATKHAFRWHHAKERELWTRLAATYPELDSEFRDDVEGFFDRVRDPDFQELPDGRVPTYINRKMLALESGIIRQMYVMNASKDDPVVAQDVVRAVAR